MKETSLQKGSQARRAATGAKRPSPGRSNGQSRLRYIPPVEGGKAALDEVSFGVPANSAFDPGAEDTVIAPCSVEPGRLNRMSPGITTELLANSNPVEPGIVLEAAPYIARDDIRRPQLIGEAACVPSQPNFPHCQASKQGPDGGKRTKTTRERLGEDTVHPVKVEVDGGVM